MLVYHHYQLNICYISN